MAFPSTVVSNLVSGIPGELAFNSPHTGIAATINSASAANNVFGRALTYSDNTIETVGAGGTGKFAGILINPKSDAFAFVGDAADNVPNGAPVSTMIEGECYVMLTTGTAPVIGGPIFFVQATGEIGAGTAGAGQSQIAGAQIFRHNASTEVPLLAAIRIKA